MQLCVKEGRYTFSFFLHFSVLYWKRKKKTALNPTSPFIERSELRPIVHCIAKKSRCSLCFSPSACSLRRGRRDVSRHPTPPRPLPHQCTFLFFDKLIRAAGSKRLFQMCARTRTRTHTFEFEHLDRPTLHSPRSAPHRLPRL